MLGEPSKQNRAYFPVGEDAERQEINKYNMYFVDAIKENRTEKGVKGHQGTGIATLNRVVRNGLFGG